MQINKLHEMVWEIENFLSPEEADAFLELINTLSEPDWNREPDKTVEYWQKRSYAFMGIGNLKIEKYAETLDARLADCFKNYKTIHKVNAILRAMPGQDMDVHRDDVELEDKINVFGIVIYLNDDYEGGEIYYPEIGLSHKPVARSMVVHRASLPHGVKKVSGNNIRYVLTSFVKGDETTKLRED